MNQARFDYEITDSGLTIYTARGKTLPAWLPTPGFQIQQGGTTALAINLVDREANDRAWSLASGFTARAKARKQFGGSTTLWSLTSAGGSIILANTLPNIVLVVDATTSAALSYTAGVFDLELAWGDVVMPVVAGITCLRKEATT